VWSPIIFVATTYDSASYTLAATASTELGASQDPARWHRVFWAIAIAILPIGLMYAGGVREAQTATLVVSLPLDVHFLAVGYCPLEIVARRPPSAIKQHLSQVALSHSQGRGGASL
jgi:choline-glycine betaine transporter